MAQAGSWPTNHPLVSPMAAPNYLLARLPPLLLIIGGAEQLLGESIMFAQKAQSAGASVQVEVFEGTRAVFRTRITTR